MMWYKIYRHIHTEDTNYNLGDQLKKIGRENFWIGYDDEPHNLVEDYLQKLYKRFFIKPCAGLEYWLYMPPHLGVHNGPHWDNDESVEEMVHPRTVGLVDLYSTWSGMYLTDMKYGDTKAEKVLWNYQEQAQLTLFGGEYAYGELPNSQIHISLYFDVWDHRPGGLERSPAMEWVAPEFTQMVTRGQATHYKGDTVPHTHVCGDQDFDFISFDEPKWRKESGTYLVTKSQLAQGT